MKLTEYKNIIEQLFDSFCKKLLKNEAISYLHERRRKANRELPLDELPPQFEPKTELDPRICYGSYEAAQRIINIYDPDIEIALRYLLPTHREIILLSYYANYNDSQIARMLGISESTVSRRKAKALELMKQTLEALHDE